MAISLEKLDPEFRDILESVLKKCAQKGVTMVPYFGERSPKEQAMLWRQSRTLFEIEERVAELKEGEGHFLAHCISCVGPQHGPRVTNAIPGYSWHQWHEAVDCYWERDGRAEWDPDVEAEKNGYRIYADEAAKAGLTAGGYWQSLRDWPHVQKRAASSPATGGFSLAAIDARMQALYG